MVLDIDELAELHQDKRLRLVTTVGMQAFVEIGGDPERLVLELLRLARMGARIEKVRLGLMS